VSYFFFIIINHQIILNKNFNREQAAEEAQRHRQIARQRAATSKTRDELEKQEKKGSIYRRRIMV